MTQLRFRDRFIRGLTFPEPSWKGRLFAMAFSAMFLLGGLMTASQWVFALGDFFRIQRWEAADALVTSSEFAGSSRSGSSSSGKILIRYDYGFRGQRYSGDRYDIGSMNTNMGVDRMKDIVQEHPPGTPLVVWVNSEKPEESIITRKLSPQAWIMIPFSIPFLLVGLLGTGYGFSAGWLYRRSQLLKRQLAPEAPSKISEALNQEYQNPNQKFIFTSMEGYYKGIILLGASLFWNGIVSVFLITMTQMLINGEKQGTFLALFLIPFVIVGTVLIVMTFRSITGPKPPSWLILADGILDGTDAHQESPIKLAWMPINGISQDFRSCSFNIVRWKEKMTLRKWKRTNTEWSKDLVEMKKNTEGEMEISFPVTSKKKSIFESNLDLHFIMSWTSRDGQKHIDSWQISPVRSE